MAIFGFLVLFGLLVVVSVMVSVTTVYLLNQYNIGGVPHTWKDRLILIPLWVVLVFCWYALLVNSPIKIVIGW